MSRQTNLFALWSVLTSAITRLLTTSIRSSLDESMQEWNLYNAGFDYNVVAVFGSQSTGKSASAHSLHTHTVRRS